MSFSFYWLSTKRFLITKNNAVRRVIASVAVASVLAASLLTGGVANVLPTSNYIVFGDFLAANPGQLDPAVPGRGGCPISVLNIGSYVVCETGLELHDYSCNGTTTFMPTQPQKSLMGQVDSAIAQGSPGPAIQLVTIYAGVSDAMQGVVLPMPVQDGLYTTNVVAAVEKIRAVNPIARVMLIGYPAFTSSDPTHYACPVNAAGFVPHIPAAGMHDLEMALQNRQQRAANESGTGFVNMEEVAHIDAAMCSPDGERQVSAILDTDVASYNMINCPTFHGSAIIGTTIASIYRSTF